MLLVFTVQVSLSLDKRCCWI